MLMPDQPTPNVTNADVERIARRDFPADRVAQVMALLQQYGTERWHNEPARVRLAALKLAAGNIELLRYNIEVAKRDYRDMLAPAEYPGYCKRVPHPGALPPDDEQRVIDDDWKQYEAWLKR